MGARSRRRAEPHDMGHALWHQYGGTVPRDDSGTCERGYEKCDDVIDGTREPHGLLITKGRWDRISRLNGIRCYDPPVCSVFKQWTNFVPELMQVPPGGHVPHSLPPDLTTLLLARTNPNRPVVMLPVAIWELRELPSLFKGMALRTAKDGANAFLNYQYGWKPFVSDLRKLLDFQSHVDRRVGELKRLYSKNGLRRRVSLGEFTVEDGPTLQVIDSKSSFVIYANRRRNTSVKLWGTVRWLPDEGTLPPSSESKYRDVARALVLGMSPDPRGQNLSIVARNLWEAMPWSWMVDWFGNVGDFLTANLNTVPCHPVQACVMNTTSTRYYYNRVFDSDEYISGGDATGLYVTKSRSVQTSASLAANLPFLSGRQLAILGALGIQRTR